MAGSDSLEEALLNIKTAIVTHERRWGPEFMEENRGHFWGLLETRPYMMVRLQLVKLFTLAEFYELAAREAEEMLTLNPSDNQGVRDPLRGLYLALAWLEELEALNKEYDDGFFATAAWSKVFLLFLKGQLKRAEKAATKAHEANPHVAGLLCGRKKPPKTMPDMYSPGSPEEAFICHDFLSVACAEHPTMVEWLSSLKALREKPSGRRKQDG